MQVLRPLPHDRACLPEGFQGAYERQESLRTVVFSYCHAMDFVSRLWIVLLLFADCYRAISEPIRILRLLYYLIVCCYYRLLFAAIIVYCLLLLSSVVCGLLSSY